MPRGLRTPKRQWIRSETLAFQLACPHQHSSTFVVGNLQQLDSGKPQPCSLPRIHTLLFQTKAMNAAILSLWKVKLWPKWSRTQQTLLLLDVLKLSILVNAAHVPVRVLLHQLQAANLNRALTLLTSIAQLQANMCQDSTTPVGIPPDPHPPLNVRCTCAGDRSVLENFFSSLMTWPIKFQHPSIHVALPLALYTICVVMQTLTLTLAQPQP